MNKKEKISFIKKELADLQTHKQLFNQSLSSIASRERYLKLELDSLGASSSTPRGKIENVLSEKQKLSLIGGLTK